MDKLGLKITIKSAQIFKSMAFFSKMQLYTVAAVVERDSSSSSSSSTPIQSTMVDMHGGAQPYWSFPMKFQIDESKLVRERTDLITLVLCIKRRRTTVLGSNKSIGIVHLPVKMLLEYYLLNLEGNRPKDVAFMILSRSGKPRGVLYISYIFGGDEMSTSIPPPLPPPRVVPSAPPLPEHEHNGYYYLPQFLSAGGGCCCSSPPATVPSAPYLEEEYMLH